MKKSRILLVVVLAVVLAVMCTFNTSFSWFSRSNSKSGDSLGWSSKMMDVDGKTEIDLMSYDGDDVSFVTYSSTDGVNYDTVVDNFSGSGIGVGERKYFRTDIINSSGVNQNVSLYISKLNVPGTSSGLLYLGTNGPLRTYKFYGDANILNNGKVPSAVNKKNYYVGFVNSQTYSPMDYSVHFWGGSRDGDAQVIIPQNGKPLGTGNYTVSSNNYNADYNMYYATIDYDATSILLKYSPTNYYYKDEGDNTNADEKNTVIWYHYDNAYHSAYVVSDIAAGINTFYESAQVAVGQTVNLAANAKGKSITYKSSNDSVAKVNSNGVVTGVSAGTATITVTAKGVYGDELSATCQVTVYSPSEKTHNNVPIVTNYLIEAGEGGAESTQSVYWYIMNDENAGGTLSYTIDGLYIGL